MNLSTTLRTLRCALWVTKNDNIYRRHIALCPTVLNAVKLFHYQMHRIADQCMHGLQTQLNNGNAWWVTTPKQRLCLASECTGTCTALRNYLMMQSKERSSAEYDHSKTSIRGYWHSSYCQQCWWHQAWRCAAKMATLWMWQFSSLYPCLDEPFPCLRMPWQSKLQ